MKHLTVTVRGKVQGVYFRAATQRRARELGLTGWVCNRTDGSVYLEAQGPQAALDALLDWLREGPPLARVDELCVEEGSGGPSEDFEIRAD